MTSIWVARARLDETIERDDRLLHPRDRRLGAQPPLPRRRSAGRRSSSGQLRRLRDPARRARARDEGNGSAFTARRFRSRLAALGMQASPRRLRDPESQAFIESWFGKLKEREVWLNEYETLDQARAAIGGVHRAATTTGPTAG